MRTICKTISVPPLALLLSKMRQIYNLRLIRASETSGFEEFVEVDFDPKYLFTSGFLGLTNIITLISYNCYQSW